MKAEGKTDEAVRGALQAFADAYRRRDLPGVLGGFAPDADVVLYGTGADEKRVGREAIRAQVERDWAQTESAAMSLGWTSVSAAGPVAWAAVDGTFTFTAGGQGGALPVRMTFVLEQREGRWRIVHCHFSTPAASQAEGRSF